MNWKNRPYWVKGGVIAYLLLVIVYMVLMAFYARWLCEYNDMGNINCSTAQVWGTAFLPFSYIPFLGMTLVAILIVFLIGALIGIVVAKVKKKSIF